MTAPGRTPCLNPRCRRTFKTECEGEVVVCGKCWKLLPQPWRARYKQLRRRWKVIERLEAKGVACRRRGRKFGVPDRGAPQGFTMRLKAERLWNRLCNRIHNFFENPEKPEGLDAFLEEMGL
jgi:hypothetical protein